jgi:hypothetical protein
MSIKKTKINTEQGQYVVSVITYINALFMFEKSITTIVEQKHYESSM